MDLRVRLIQEYDEGENISALAEMYGVARKTVYKWLARHEEEGAAGLADRSRVPHHYPGRVAEELVAHIVAARQRWHWGPRKLRVKLAAAHPEMAWPAESTIGEVLKRAGLTHPRKPRVRTPPYGRRFASVEAANQTWCADFKGWFRTGDGTRCDPLTITDAHSRYLLRCHITPKTDGVHVAGLFDAAFREYGLPVVIHTDNGVPFASRAPGGLSRVSMQWVKLGIVPERSRPASPQDNGRHERMHSTLKQATLQPPNVPYAVSRKPLTGSRRNLITSVRMRLWRIKRQRVVIGRRAGRCRGGRPSWSIAMTSSYVAFRRRAA